METKKCAQCGQEKPIEEFSKSYKNLCKRCVAGNERLKRSTPIMNGKNIGDTDERFIPSPLMTTATAAMQGLLSSGRVQNSPEFIAKMSVSYAKALLNELREQDNGV